jgi:hypothetical protein
MGKLVKDEQGSASDIYMIEFHNHYLVLGWAAVHIARSSTQFCIKAIKRRLDGYYCILIKLTVYDLNGSLTLQQ